MHQAIKDIYSRFGMTGDSGLIAEEIMAEKANDTLQRCKVVEMSVEDGDFDLPAALKHYDVSATEYVLYQEAKNLSPRDTTRTALYFAFGEIAFAFSSDDPSFFKNMILIFQEMQRRRDETKMSA